MSSLDWKKCCICQENKSETLKCPLNSNGPSEANQQTYHNFIENIQHFREAEALPIELQFEEGIDAACLIENKASWHKSCRLKFSLSKLKKAQERVERKIRHEETLIDEPKVAGPSTRKRKKPLSGKTHQCLFCLEGDLQGEKLHNFTMLETDRRIRQMACELEDFELLGKMSHGDLIAIEACYHLKCITRFKNRYRSFCSQKVAESDNIDKDLDESVAFVELIKHIEGCVDDGVYMFKLSDLSTLYTQRLNDLGIEKIVNKSRLKNAILEHYGKSLQEQSDGKNTVLAFQEGLIHLIKGSFKRDFSKDAEVLAAAAGIIRNDIFAHPKFNFSGSFPLGCQETYLPSSLKSLVSMILNGLDINDQDKTTSQPCLTISQTLIFNTKRRSYKKKTNLTRHPSARELPFPLYVGLSIHSATRSKTLIEKFYQMGISISYDRVMEIEERLAKSLCERFNEDGCVSPTILRKGLFSVGALDNLDHNPSSTTSVSSFHGTGISIFQFPTESVPGQCRPPLVLCPSKESNLSELPASYAMVPAVALNTSTVSLPPFISRTLVKDAQTVNKAKELEENWVSHGLTKLKKDEVTSEDAFAWAAFHSSSQVQPNEPPAITALLPLFYEKAATPAMIRHGMDVLAEATMFLNPGQVPVMTLDQPLFAIAKAIQWKWPDNYGEDKFVVMFGGLHLEMTMWNTIGDLLDGSGWTTILTEAEVASTGVAQGLLRSSHLKRTRHAHQVSLLALHALKQEAYLTAGSSKDYTFTEWEKTMEKSPTFIFWNLIMKYQTLILLFVRAHRERNFRLFVDVLEQFVPLFFSLDHTNYARWVPVHIRDMRALPESTKREFVENNHWVLSKTSNKFSFMPLDQAHEQANRNVKGAGGAVGLTENPVAFRRWMLSGPELSRMIMDFEDQYISITDPDSLSSFENHESGAAAQKTFHRQVRNVCDVIRRIGNPFLDNFSELVILDSRDCADVSVIESIARVEELGECQYKKYVKDVIEHRSTSINDPIKQNSLVLFRKNQKKMKTKQAKRIEALQSYLDLFAQMYVSLHSREGDMKEFFSHEVHSFPPSLSEFGSLRLPSSKSDILRCIQPSGNIHIDPPSSVDCRVLDGAVIVHCLPIVAASTFDEYAEKVFIPHIQYQLNYSNRIDVVWDTYLPDSIKEATREKRGDGVRRKVAGQTKLPKNWMAFLRDPTNKSELFSFLTAKVSQFQWPQNKAVYITSGTSVVSRCANNQSAMGECNHEEADTRMVVHVRHALEGGSESVIVRTVDSDVVVILVGKFHDLLTYTTSAKVWVALGMGRHYSTVSINQICSSLGEPISRALPVFYAFTGCDTTSQFCGIGKTTAWHAWQSNREVTPVLEYIASNPFQEITTSSECFRHLERLTVIMYDKSSPFHSVNETRMMLFSKRNRNLDNIPPTQDALLQHVKRVIYQAGIWTTAEQPLQNIPSPSEFAWVKLKNKWQPVWMTIPRVASVCRGLLKCSCKAPCSRCKCKKEKLKCTPLCSCSCPESQS